MSNLTYDQLAAIEQYRTKLEQNTDIANVRRQALASYRQNLVMHNTYRNIINHHLLTTHRPKGQ